MKRVKGNRRIRQTVRIGGFTLIEVLVSLTIMLVVCLVLFNLFHASLQYSTDIKKQYVAAILAEKKIEEIRSWAHTQNLGEYKFSGNWETYDGKTFTDPANPGYEIKVTAKKGGPFYDPETETNCLYLPCSASQIKQAHNGRKIRMTDSMSRIQIDVSWDKGRQKYTTIYCLSEPPRSISQLAFTFNGSTTPPSYLGKNQSVIIEATAKDRYGKTIKDVSVKWLIEPGTPPGNAEIVTFPAPNPESDTGHDPLLGNDENTTDPINYPLGNKAVLVNRVKTNCWTPSNPIYRYVNNGSITVKALATSGAGYYHMYPSPTKPITITITSGNTGGTDPTGGNDSAPDTQGTVSPTPTPTRTGTPGSQEGSL